MLTILGIFRGFNVKTTESKAFYWSRNIITIV